MLKPPKCHWFLQDTLEFVMSCPQCDLTSFGIVGTGPAPKTEALATTGPYLVSCLGSSYEGWNLVTTVFSISELFQIHSGLGGHPFLAPYFCWQITSCLLLRYHIFVRHIWHLVQNILKIQFFRGKSHILGGQYSSIIILYVIINNNNQQFFSYHQ